MWIKKQFSGELFVNFFKHMEAADLTKEHVTNWVDVSCLYGSTVHYCVLFLN